MPVKFVTVLQLHTDTAVGDPFHRLSTKDGAVVESEKIFKLVIKRLAKRGRQADLVGRDTCVAAYVASRIGSDSPLV